ncbi:Uma2 family endonuclease [Tumidithrix elongata RA019]|uniref:Uma2 family endonuclease n=1 Tax=Tumidithrix elongata BACA0141 TaxID=2716417 RepID=A0AAW9Q9Z8_9CYAN|nr:Uma2 family endonuclease [Tumidithrix elongata RA019]
MVAITETRSQPQSSSLPSPTSEVEAEIIYPSSDGEPLAETQQHVLAILMTLMVLRLYLQEQQAVVFADQFLYYIEGKPRARVAPDVMVVFDIEKRLYPNYKIWEGQQTPAIIFEVTSAGTKEVDWNFKKTLYEQLGVTEYWLFDPYGEWVPKQLQGYRLNEDGIYKPIADNCSEVLQLKLQAEEYLIGFYRLDNGEKLQTLEELDKTVQEAKQRAEQADQRAEQADQRAEQEAQKAEQERIKAEQERLRADRLAEKLRQLGVEIEDES